MTALTSFPMLKRMEAARLSILQASYLLLAAGFLLGLLIFLFTDVNQELPYLAAAQFQVIPRALAGIFVMLAFVQAAIFYSMGRLFDLDIKLLARLVPVDEYLGPLNIRRGQLLVTSLIIYTFITVLGHALDHVSFQLEPQLRYLGVLQEGSAMIVIWYVSLPVVCISTAKCFCGYVQQSRVLASIALSIPIHFHRLEELQVLASALVRALVAGLIFLSVVVAFVVTLSNDWVFVAASIFGILTVLMPLLIAFFNPILIIRSRVRKMKQDELDNIRDALDKLDLADPEDRAQQAQLLTQQMFVESRWEWPLASHVQTIILFGLVPPITWVLAAVIENLLFGS